ncbi:hypothetical protein Hanom_Chr06g00533261 [Helianthus anomalus]
MDSISLSIASLHLTCLLASSYVVGSALVKRTKFTALLELLSLSYNASICVLVSGFVLRYTSVTFLVFMTSWFL